MIANTAVLLDTPVPLLISNVSPTENLNYLGGDVLVILGTGFGYDSTKINITFDSGIQCDVSSLISTGIVCQT